MKKEDKYILLWGEHVDIKKFLIGLFIQLIVLIPSLYFIDYKGFKIETSKMTISNGEIKLLAGLILIIIVAVINAKWIKPKRNIKVNEVNNNDN